ncbi:VOC family protein [Nakamurella aerolata]|uniref:VOC family protein n=1 Tax=Nakamurella aerolata TaxID=1656892 RepID=UPI003CCCEA6A
MVPERKSGTKNRLHLDIQVSDGEQPVEQRAEVVRKKADELCAGGASIVRRIEIDDAGYYFVVLHDPEGNEFCIS